MITKQIKRQRIFSRTFVMVLAVSLTSAGCAGLSSMSPTAKATLGCGAGGAAIGAVAGALIDKGNRGRGALLGGALGALLGAGTCFVIASYKNREVADYQQTKEETNYDPSVGNVVKIDEFTVSPDKVTPGESVTFGTQYYVMTPDPDQDITVTESRIIKRYDEDSGTYEELGQSVDQITMKPGTRRGDGSITLNNSTPEGKYLIALAVELNGQKAESESPLLIGGEAISGVEPKQDPELLLSSVTGRDTEYRGAVSHR